MFVSDWTPFSGQLVGYDNGTDTMAAYLAFESADVLASGASLTVGHKYYTQIDVADINGIFKEVSTLPTANSETMKYVYVVNSGSTCTFYGTVETVQNGVITYSFEQLRTTTSADLKYNTMFMTHFILGDNWHASRRGTGISDSTASSSTSSNGEMIASLVGSTYASLRLEFHFSYSERDFWNYCVGKYMGFVARLIIVDLTEEYGSGNEPSTIAAFKALYPSPYSYNKVGKNLWKYYNVSKVLGTPGRVGKTNC